LYSPLLAAIKEYCDEIFDFGQFIQIPHPLAAGMFIMSVGSDGNYYKSEQSK